MFCSPPHFSCEAFISYYQLKVWSVASCWKRNGFCPWKQEHMVGQSMGWEKGDTSLMDSCWAHAMNFCLLSHILSYAIFCWTFCCSCTSTFCIYTFKKILPIKIICLKIDEVSVGLDDDIMIVTHPIPSPLLPLNTDKSFFFVLPITPFVPLYPVFYATCMLPRYMKLLSMVRHVI